MRDVVAGFRRAVGRDPTDEEIETLTPLFMRAGYDDDDDLLWGLVFLFARQFGAVGDAVSAIEAAGASAARTVERESKRVTALGHPVVWVLGLVVVLGVGLFIGLQAGWSESAADAAANVEKGRLAAIRIVRGYSPDIAERLFDVPAKLNHEEMKWCGSGDASTARAMSPDEIAWCASSAGEAARELGPDIVSWAGSDVGRRARELTDESTVEFLASPWGRTALWAWTNRTGQLWHLEYIVHCYAKQMQRVRPEGGDYEVCQIDPSYTGHFRWWVPQPHPSTVE